MSETINVTQLAADMVALQAEVTALKSRVATTKADQDEALDTIWMIYATSLIFFMHSGFSLLEAGSVRFRNTQNILVKNLMVVTVGFLCWWSVGWAIAFGVDWRAPVSEASDFNGSRGWFMHGLWDNSSMMKFWFFQGMFCATGGTIVSGSMAERTKIKGFTIYVIAMTTLIYPFVVYWAWSTRGFLNRYTDDMSSMESIFGPPLIDFAGSGVVHMVGGVGALFGAAIVGPRKDRYAPGTDAEFDGHNMPFCVMGTFFLWFGWYGFNPGSTGVMHSSADAQKASLVAVNTTMAPCLGGLVVFFLRARVLEPRRLDVGGFCNGILAGLVGVTACCATIKPWEAAIVGLIAGCLYQAGSMLLPRLQIDDVVDAFPVHGVCGCWSVLAAGLFGDPEEGHGGNGSLYGGDQFPTQIGSALIIGAWSAGWSLIILLPLRVVGFLRLNDEFQEKGADVMEHSPAKAYMTHGDQVIQSIA
mmetsp:Transcript_65565/g.142290  ORF Transcript_65565/g.142290 Transcript_65565/m.142290 type:complete len:473 (+) Transcript_65565:49-1467(+)